MLDESKALIKTFEIHNFRKFEHIKFDDLGRINLFLGNNNTGKTTILEAFYTFGAGIDIGNIMDVCILKRLGVSNKYDLVEKIQSTLYNSNEIPYKFSFNAKLENGKEQKFEHIIKPTSIFSDLSEFKAIKYVDLPYIAKYVILNNGEEKRSVNITFALEELMPNSALSFKLAHFNDILDHRNNRQNLRIYRVLKKNKIMEEFIQSMRQSFSEIKDITFLPYDDGTIPPITIDTIDDKTRPLYTFGDGVQRWYNILGGMILVQNAIHCIEEIDVSFHPKAQKNLFINLLKYAKKYNNQLIMSSHNLEFVDNMLEALYGEEGVISESEEDPVRIYKLKYDESEKKTRMGMFTGREAFEIRKKYNLEIR